MSVKLRTRKYAKGNIKFYLDIYTNGNRTYEFLDIGYFPRDKDKKEKKELADKIRAKRELEVSSQDHGFVPKHLKRSNFLVFYENFLDNYRKKDKRIFRYAKEKFQDFYPSNKLPMSKITQKLIEEFRNYLLSEESKLTGETPYDYLARFKRVLKTAHKEGMINPHTFSLIQEVNIKRRNNQLKKNILTASELKMLMSKRCGNEEVKKAFIFSCFTGLGEAEIRKLTWDRILPDKKIKLFREKSGEQIINSLHSVALQMIGNRGEANELVFRLPSNVAVSKNLKNWVELSEIEKNISFYCGRHTFATLLLVNGANLKTVADCLGHADTKHTLKYLNYVSELKDKAIEKLPLLD